VTIAFFSGPLDARPLSDVAAGVGVTGGFGTAGLSEPPPQALSKVAVKRMGATVLSFMGCPG